MKNWIDSITDKQLIEFLMKELHGEKVSCIKRSKKRDEIRCKILTVWNGEAEDSYHGKKGVLGMNDIFIIKQSKIYTFNYDVSDIQDKWQMYQIALGIHPWQTDNPYIKKQDEGTKDCLSCNYSVSEAKEDHDVLHCMFTGDKVVEDNGHCKNWC